jgi:hypothetical protein
MPASPPVTVPVGGAIPAVASPPRPPTPPGEIRPSGAPSTVKTAPAPKPGSARARMEADLESRAAKEPGAPARTSAERPGATQAEIPAAVSTEVEEPPTTETPPETEPGEARTPPEKPPGTTTEAPPADAKGKKVSPWKLVEEYKGKLAKAEQEIATIKSSLVPEAERSKIEARVQAAEKRAAELDEHIKYVDYTKSGEFQQKFQAPYENAFKRAMADLKDLSVPGADGTSTRPFGPEDLLQLVNMERGQARKVAEELFGSDAADVLAARLECRKLWDERETGLTEAKKSGNARVQQAQQQYRAAVEAITKATKQTWDTVNAGLLNDPEIGQFFKPRDGDQEWNQRLAKGFQLVDTAFSQDPRDPKLTPDQRSAVVKRHAAVRNRAAAWGAMRHDLTKALDRIKTLEKKLGGYKTSTPPAAGTTPSGGPAAELHGMARLNAGIDKLARH